MRVHSLCRRTLLGFFVSLLFAASFCYGDEKTIEVFGVGECVDCKENNVNTSEAVTGLRVTIDCKLEKGEMKRLGVGELDKEGKFKVSLHEEIVQDGKLKEECYAQLHSAFEAPCPVHNGLEGSKIVLKSKTHGKHTFGPNGNLKFSTAWCTSTSRLPLIHKYATLRKIHPWKKHFPKVSFPTLKNFSHVFPLPPFPPTYKQKPQAPVKPIPPPKPPVHKPPAVVKPPPPVPVYKPKPPVHKPPVKKACPPSVPIYKPKPKAKPPVHKTPVAKPLPPPVPIYKPKPPVHKTPGPKPLPPPIPIYKPKPPVYIPPIAKPFPPFPKKPYPPFPKLPPFHHPKYGVFPPLPPSIPQP